MARATRQQEPKPYFSEEANPSAEWRAELTKLLGFDIELLRTRLLEWLRGASFASHDRHGNVRIGEIPREPSTKEERRAVAVMHVLKRLLGLEKMYAPERVAWVRWSRALDDLEKAVVRGTQFARVRELEDAFFFCTAEGQPRNATTANAANFLRRCGRGLNR